MVMLGAVGAAWIMTYVFVKLIVSRLEKSDPAGSEAAVMISTSLSLDFPLNRERLYNLSDFTSVEVEFFSQWLQVGPLEK